MFSLFCLEDPAFCSLLIQMLFQKFENNIDSFNLFGEVSLKVLYASQRPLLLSEVFRMKARDNSSKNRGTALAFVEAEKKLLKQLRFTRSTNPLDTVTFSVDAVKNFEKLLAIFNTIAGGQLFLRKSATGNDRGPYNLPLWFLGTGSGTIGSWIVAHFEARIIDFYTKERALKELTCETALKSVDKLQKMWNYCSEKGEVLRGAIEKIQ